MGRAEDIYERIKSEGEAAIDRFIDDRQSEELFLDFKRSSDNGSGKKLHQIDRENFASAISGFGNSEGGVIVWGVDCSPTVGDSSDVARYKEHIKKPGRFRSWLEGVVSGCTIPAHQLVENHVLISSDNNIGFVITLIPKSPIAPHQVVTSGKRNLQYLVRAGSSFVQAPHAVLSGMFGRLPIARIVPNFIVSEYIDSNNNEIVVELGIMAANMGPGIAVDTFVTITVNSTPGPNCRMWFQPDKQGVWESWDFMKLKFTSVTKREVRLPPQVELMPVVISIRLKPPFVNEFDISGYFGCSNSPMYPFQMKTKPEHIDEEYKRVMLGGNDCQHIDILNINEQAKRHNERERPY